MTQPTATMDRTRMWLLSIFSGVLSAATGGAAAIILFALMIRIGWLDGPGGGLVILPLMLVLGIPSGFCGFLFVLGKLNRRMKSN